MKLYFMINGDKMVLIIDKNNVSSVYFPKNIQYIPDFEGSYGVTIKSDLNHIERNIGLNDKGISQLVYEFDFEDMLADIPDGEYNYTIIAYPENDEDIIVGEGLLRIGNLKYSPKQSNYKAKKIIQYGE